MIEVARVSKCFRRHTGRKLLRDQVLDWFRRPEPELFWALKDVSFRVAEGESVALIGPNGAGKSTMLSLVTGLARPDSGTVRVSGRVAALLELGSGFHPDLTGEENVLMNAALLGFSERQAKARMRAIVEFSEIGKFIEERGHFCVLACRLFEACDQVIHSSLPQCRVRERAARTR